MNFEWKSMGRKMSLTRLMSLFRILGDRMFFFAESLPFCKTHQNTDLCQILGKNNIYNDVISINKNAKGRNPSLTRHKG